MGNKFFSLILFFFLSFPHTYNFRAFVFPPFLFLSLCFLSLLLFKVSSGLLCYIPQSFSILFINLRFSISYLHHFLFSIFVAFLFDLFLPLPFSPFYFFPSHFRQLGFLFFLFSSFFSPKFSFFILVFHCFSFFFLSPPPTPPHSSSSSFFLPSSSSFLWPYPRRLNNKGAKDCFPYPLKVTY